MDLHQHGNVEGRISVLLMRATVQTGKRQLSCSVINPIQLLPFRRITTQCYCKHNCSSRQAVEAAPLSHYFIEQLILWPLC